MAQQSSPRAAPAKPGKAVAPAASVVPPELTTAATPPAGYQKPVFPAPKPDEGGIAGGVPANDNCANSTLLTCGGAGLADDNNNATVDGPANPPCSFGGQAINSDVWYRFVATQNSATVTLCGGGTHTDTLLSVYSGTCGALTSIACNDDSCGPTGLVSSVTATGLTVGQTYLIQAGGWNTTATGSWTISVTCFATTGCPTCTDNEGEPTCGDNYVDATNGGCNSTPPVFTNIACGQTVCGESGTYLFQGLQYRDTDWWLVNVTAPTNLTLTVNADFPVLIGFVAQPCPQTAFIAGTAVTGTAPCVPVTSTAVGLAPGQYVAFIGPSVFTGVPCTAKYQATLTASNPDACLPSGRCCNNTTHVCSVTSQTACTASGGTWTAGGTCPAPGYVAANCGNILENISGSGTMAPLSSACDDCSDLNIPIGFNFNFFGNNFNTIALCSNGFATFEQSGASPFTNVAIPNPAAPNNLVCPFWDDFNTATGGDVFYQTLAAPQRFVVQWNNVVQFGQTTGSATFQLILFATGNIEFRYGTMTPATPYTPTVGIENSTGTVGTQLDPSGPSAGNTCRSLTFQTPTNPCLAACPGDRDGDGDVDVDDLIWVILHWAQPDASGIVDVDDLIAVILGWGCHP